VPRRKCAVQSRGLRAQAAEDRGLWGSECRGLTLWPATRDLSYTGKVVTIAEVRQAMAAG